MNIIKLATFCVVAAASIAVHGQEPLSDTSWNFRTNAEDRFHSNEAWVRPWQSGQPQPPWPATNEAGSGGYVGNFGYSIPWSGVNKRPGGAFSYSASRDHQFHAWTYLYVENAKTIQLSGGGDCIPSSFLNGAFDSRGNWVRSLPLNAG